MRSLSFGFSNQNPVWIFLFSTWVPFAPPISFLIWYPDIIMRVVQIMKLFNMQFSPPFRYFLTHYPIRQLADGLSPQRLKFDPRSTHVWCAVQSGNGTSFLYKPFGLPLSLSFHPRFTPISIYLQLTLVAPCSRIHAIALFPSAIRIFGGNLPPLYSSIFCSKKVTLVSANQQCAK